MDASVSFRAQEDPLGIPTAAIITYARNISLCDKLWKLSKTYARGSRQNSGYDMKNTQRIAFIRHL